MKRFDLSITKVCYIVCFNEYPHEGENKRYDLYVSYYKSMKTMLIPIHFASNVERYYKKIT